MAMQSTTNPADVADRLQKHFSKKLLHHAINTLVMDQFALLADLPKNAGSKEIAWFRRGEASTSDIQTLTEGVAITTFREIALTRITATLVQRGEAAKISDVLRLIDMFEPLQQNIQQMGEDAALDADTIARNSIITGQADANSGQERFAGVPPTGDSSDDFGTLSGLSTAAGKITRPLALGAITQLRVNKAPKINGYYVSVICPQVAHDFVQDPDWLEGSKYSDIQRLWKGEIGMLDGVKYVEHTNPFRETVYGTYAAAGAVYSTLFLGRDAYGVPKLAGTGSPFKPSVIINDKPDKSDPLGQFIVAGWKAFYVGKLLNTNFVVNVRSKSTFA